ncbi:efflux RND transporter periplasmic adaptor subunit [Variovorax terrae]|uniref:Efflux RND transporter periplasmic adaptor subunit n=1 Tax=Variovorax terrae TaxID=2923278 RepID=A0A9X1VYF9_9BURK|nr:efflux RND transporter periplasmic adaptor subunit [Variovorax terrae]MCJ0765159.1 efflux RND transporter periplasmic adaptor subunit [Variovorax terrae]
MLKSLAPLWALPWLAWCCAGQAQTVAPPAPPAELRISAAQSQALGIALVPAKAVQNLVVAATGRVQPALGAQSAVAAPFAGAVSRLLVAPGSAVRAGQALAHFNSPDWFEARRAQAEARAQADLAEGTLRRDAALYEEGIIPAARWRAAQARVQETRAALLARTQVLQGSGIQAAAQAQPVLVAPAAGTVIEVNAVAGQRFAAGDTLFRLAQGQQLEVEALLPATAALPRAGDAALMPTHEAAGTVLAVVPALDGSATQRVRIGVTQAGRLQAGQSVPLQLRLAAPSQALPAGQALVQVPARAVFQWRNQPAVFVASGDTVRPVAVRPWSADDDTAVVQGALGAGSRVVATGIAALKGLLQGEP